MYDAPDVRCTLMDSMHKRIILDYIRRFSFILLNNFCFPLVYENSKLFIAVLNLVVIDLIFQVSIMRTVFNSSRDASKRPRGLPLSTCAKVPLRVDFVKVVKIPTGIDCCSSLSCLTPGQ